MCIERRAAPDERLHRRITFLRSLSLALVLVSSGCARPKPGPEDLLKRYVEAIRSDQPQRAYRLLAEPVRQRVTKEQFVARWKTVRGELRAQADALQAKLAANLSTTATAQLDPKTKADLVYGPRGWKIEQGPGVSSAPKTPREVLQALLGNLKRHDYQAVSQLFSKHLRELWQNEINEWIEALDKSLEADIEVKGDRAMIRMNNKKLELIKEPDGWKIEDMD